MKIERIGNGFTLRNNPSETVVSVIVLAIATLTLVLSLADIARPLYETVILLLGCALLYAAGTKALIRARRDRLTVTDEGVRVRHGLAPHEDDLLRWEDVRDWGTAAILHRGRYGLYHPRFFLFFSAISRATAEDAFTSPHAIELMKFDREELESSGLFAYCRDHIAAAQGEAAPAERDQWLTAGHG